MMIRRLLWCLAVTGWAVATDVKIHKIKNYTVVVGIVGGLLLNAENIRVSLLGMAVPLALLVLFAVNMMGAGDIKLLCAVGAIVGYPDIVRIILYSFVFCGIHILLHAGRRRRVPAMLQGVWHDLLSMLLSRRINRNHNSDTRLPMAGSIAAASLVTLVTSVLQH